MSEVNVLWISPWSTLQKNLAISLAAAAVAIDSASQTPAQARELTLNWLMRAQRRMVQMAPIVQ